MAEHWQWIGALVFVLPAAAIWVWHAYFSAHDKAGWPRGRRRGTARQAALRLRALQMRRGLDGYYAAARRELTRFRGCEIDTAGDGFFAAFDGPARAIRCARATNEAVRELGIETRVGVHTGECEVIGEKIGGIAVHIGARVAGKANAPVRPTRSGRRAAGGAGAPGS